MSNNNLETEMFNEHLEQMAAQLGLTTAALQNMTAEERAAAREFKKYQDEYNAKIKKAGDTVVGFGKDLGGIGKQALNGAGSFTTLNSVVDLSVKVLGGLANAIPVVGGAFKALGEAAGDVTKLMIEQFQTGWNAYKDLQDIGLASSFDDMRQSAAATGLLFQDVNKSLGKYSTDFANFGGSVAGGLKEFRKTSYELTDVRKQFNALGIGAVEFTEYQAKYMAQETRLGRSRNANLTEGTQKYIEQLDTLSKLTGLSRKDLQAQRDAALSETKFGAALSRLGPEVQESFQNLNSYITSKGGPELAQGLRDLTSGAVTSDAAKQLMLATGGKAAEVVDRMKSGMLTAEQGFEELRKSLNPKQMAEFAQYVGDSSIASKGFAQIQRMYNSKAPTQADINREVENRKKLLSGQDKETSALANTENQLYDTSRNLQLLMTSSSLVQMGMDTMSDALDELSVKMLEMSGKAMPEELRARIEERKAIRAVNEAKEKERVLSEGLVEQQEKIIDLQAQIAKETDPRKKRNLERQLAAAKREEEFRRGPHAQEGRDEARRAVEEAEKKAEEARIRRQRVSGLTARETRQQQDDSLIQNFDEKKFEQRDLANFKRYSDRKKQLYDDEIKAIEADTKLTQQQKDERKRLATENATKQARREFLSAAGAAGATGSAPASAPPAQPQTSTPPAAPGARSETTSGSSPAAPTTGQSRAPAASAPAQAPSTPAPSTPAPSTPASSTPASSTPARSAPSAAPATSGAAAAPVDSRSALEKSIEQIKKLGLKIRGWGDVYQGGPLTDKAGAVAQAIQSSIEGFGMFTGLNDVFHKEKHPNSTHTKGRGIDFTMAKTPSPEEANQIKKKLQGLSGVASAKNEYYGPDKGGDANQWTTGPHFHVDAQARTGGIFKGPSTGYLIEAHDEEIVVPASDGVSKQALNSGVFGQDTKLQERLVALLETFIEKQDVVIDLLDDNNSNGKKLVNAMA